MDYADIIHRFHPAPNDEKRNAYTSVRAACATTAHHINASCPDGREKSVAITKLEEAMFWANAALTRAND
jgi:hypothetical protein